MRITAGPGLDNIPKSADSGKGQKQEQEQQSIAERETSKDENSNTTRIIFKRPAPSPCLPPTTTLTQTVISVDRDHNQVAKRRKLEESNAYYSDLIQDLDTIKDKLIQEGASKASQTTEIKQLTTEIERLSFELDAEKQKTPSSEILVEMVKLKESLASSEKKSGKQSKVLKATRDQNQKLSEEKQKLETWTTVLTSTISDMESNEAHLMKEGERLTEELAVVRKDEGHLRCENDALKDLAGMFVSAIDMNKFLEKVRGGSDFDEALQTSMRKRNQI